MGKFILLLLLVAVCGAGYVTRPTEEAQRAAADAVLKNPDSISEGMEGLGATIAGSRIYFDYYVATRYQIRLDGVPVVDCWGAFTQTKCTRNKATT
jgi:hypothetical protein